ncbi:hypothetical protein TMEN_9493 [Trichophyton mentagrophytes]|nr:hypothetical protein TMEN_9493 [Trichophyton mentagrophytes]
MEPNVGRGVFAPLARIAQLHERNVQLSKEVDDLHTQLLREIARQGVVLPPVLTAYPEPKSRVQDLKRIVKYINKKTPAWRIRVLQRRNRLANGGNGHNSDEEMEDATESSTSGIKDIIPGENQMVAKRVTHELTHGGDIVDDVAAILYAEEKGMPDVAEFKHDFLCAYCVTFESAMEIVKSGPIELLTTFDILATITGYPAWKKMEAGEAQKDRAAIAEMAMHVIQTALVMKDAYRAALFGPDGILEATYHRMQDMYLNIILGIRKYCQY